MSPATHRPALCTTVYNAEYGALLFHSPTPPSARASVQSDSPSSSTTTRRPPSPVRAAVLERRRRRHDALALRVNLSAPSGQTEISVHWATIDSAAQPQAGVDYAPGSGTLTFAPGETSKSVPFVVHGDTVDEPGQLYNAEWGASRCRRRPPPASGPACSPGSASRSSSTTTGVVCSRARPPGRSALRR